MAAIHDTTTLRVHTNKIKKVKFISASHCVRRAFCPVMKNSLKEEEIKKRRTKK